MAVHYTAEAEAHRLARMPLVLSGVPGALIPQAAAERLVRLMAEMELHENLVAATVVGVARPITAARLAVLLAMEESLAAAEAAEVQLIAERQVRKAEMEEGARCEYGLGSSEQRRTEWPSCAEA